MITAKQARSLAATKEVPTGVDILYQEREALMVKMAKIDAQIRISNTDEDVRNAIADGKNHVVVDRREPGYGSKLTKLGSTNEFREKPRENPSVRRCPQGEAFDEVDTWRYVIPALQAAGYQLSLEETVTSLDELGRPLFLLVIYWD